MGSAKYLKLIQTIRLDLLELFGSGYVIDHCITALSEERKKKQTIYYISNRLMDMNEILATQFGGRYAQQSLFEVLEGEDKPIQETRTGEQIKRDLMAKINSL